MIIGLLPALQVSQRTDHAQFLTTRGATASSRARRLPQTFVVIQVAMAVVLLVASGLLLASVNRLLDVPLGFGAERVSTARIGLHGAGYESRAAYVAFVDRVIDALSAKPGVLAAGVTSSVPFDNSYTAMQVRREADRENPAAEAFLTQWRVIGGDYLEAMNIPVAGRRFTAADDGTVPCVTIINDTLARQVFGDQDPLDRHILVSNDRSPYRVIGVTRDVRLTALDRPPGPAMYFHYRQFSWRTLAVVARTAHEGSAVSDIRSAIATVDPTLPVFDERSMTAVINAAVSTPRMNATLLSTFAMLALTLAAIGVYGVMSYAALQRTPEMSLRLVLGARPASVFLLVSRSGLQLAAVGVVIGLVAAAATANALDTLLFEVSALESDVYAAAVAVVTIVAVAACCIPARRAMRTDPNTILRQE